MILISRKVDYAILALHHLMRAPTGVSSRELAERYSLSKAFTANILKQLCQEGFVESQRGINGGYKLARPASEINLGMIISALDGPFQLMSCSSSETHESSCQLVGVCPVRSPLQIVHERIIEALSKVSLEDLGKGEGQTFVPLNMASVT